MIGTVALYIVGGIVLFFALLGAIRAEVVLSYAEEFGLRVRVAGIPITILPAKKKKVKLGSYSVKARAKHDAALEKKRLAKAEKSAAKKKKKEEKKAQEAADKAAGKPKKKKMPLPDLISLILAVVKIAVARFGKHIRVRIARLHLAIGSEDAAKTAILYGTISQSVCYLAYLLDSTATLRFPARSDVDIHADYLSETITCDMEIGVSICVWQLFDIVFRAGWAALKQLIRAKRASAKKSSGKSTPGTPRNGSGAVPQQKKSEPRKEI